MNLLKYKNIIIFSLLGFILFIFIILKTGNNGRIRQEMSRLKAKIENIHLLAGDEEKFNKEYEKIQGKIELAYKKIPEEAEIPHAIDELTSAIESLNLKILSIIPKEQIEVRKKKAEPGPGPIPEGELLPDMLGGESTKPDYIHIPIEINMQGSYADFGKYLDNLRNLSRMFTLEECNIEKTNEAGILNIQFIASIYYSEK